jgi:hypothetical protein
MASIIIWHHTIEPKIHLLTLGYIVIIHKCVIMFLISPKLTCENYLFKYMLRKSTLTFKWKKCINTFVTFFISPHHLF